VGSFGEKLRKEREKRKISLDDISLSTKIGLRFLHALEAEDFEQLPGGIFNKGFVRAYARHVGIDEEEAVADYLEAVGQTQLAGTSAALPEVHAAEEQAEPPQKEDASTAQIPWGILAIILLLLAIAFALWSYYARNAQAERLRTSGPPASVAGSSPGSGTSAAAGAELEASPVAVPGETVAAGSKRVGTAAGPPTSAAARKPTGVPVLAAANAPPPPAQASSLAFTLLIRASEDSWLSISVDGRAATEETLVAPGEKSITASREVVVKAGNVGGLDFFVNGRRLPPQGDYGEVRTLIFTGGGVRMARPAADNPSGLN